MNTIEKIINTTVNGDGDSDRHLTTLLGIALGSKAKTIIELGVRGGGTTLPLLEAARINDGMLFSVDIEDTDFEPNKEQMEHWSFHKGDSIGYLRQIPSKVNIDLIYIDDWHSYEHVKEQLEIIDSLVSPSTIIVLHDLMYGGTCPFYHSDLTESAGDQWAKGGPYRAVAELNPQFWEFSTLPWNNGLTILRKKYSSKFKQR
jgi:predicted O-methyltransferase YrrM|tara:strand:- start:15496 stop:16101 length:606 start_codon:yes stop_codon:yes gene_type:complete